MVVSTVFTVSFSVALFVVVCVVLSFVVLSFVVLPFVVLTFVFLSFVVVSFVLGGEEGSFVVLLEVEVFSVVDSFVVVLGVEGCVVVALDVDFCVVVMDAVVVSFALVIDCSAVVNCVAFRTEVWVATVPTVVELLVEAVEFGDVPVEVTLDLTSVVFFVDVPLAGDVSI